MRDSAGATLLTFKGRKAVEEGEKATAKQKERVGPRFLDAARSFSVTFLSVPD